MSVPRFALDPMRLGDIEQVLDIDHLSFPLPWSAETYRYEVRQNVYSQMVVVNRADAPPEPGRWRSLWERLRGHSNGHALRVLGYGGFWFYKHEAHISTIAVHPQYRGKGLGEAMLAAMIWRGMALHAGEVTLEVRVSNARAIRLYEKYGFERAGVKAGYYRDNNEDAYDMRVAITSEAYRAELAAHWADLVARLGFEDRFTAAPLPVIPPELQ